jgi:hypothetical protein
MSYFFIGVNILFVATVIFYIVFVSLVYYWHDKKTTFVIVPLLYTFDFFIIGFLIVSLFSISLKYLPKIISMLN